MSWSDIEQFLPPDQLAGLVPEGYSPWRPLVVDAMAFFLRRLPADRLRRIIGTQEALESGASSAARLVALLHECPTLHKLGQVIARHRQLDADLRTQLQQLETFEPRTPWTQIAPIVTTELSRAGRAFDIRVDPQPLAEASVAVILAITYEARSAGRSEEERAHDPCGPCEPASPGIRHLGVLKVLKPAVSDKLHGELDIFGELADYLEDRRQAYGLPPFEYRDTLDTVRELLLSELRLDQEQANLAAAARRYADRSDVVIPRPLPFSTPRLTAMSRISGVKATACAAPHRRRLARTIVDALLAAPLMNADNESVFHADCHAGNLFATPDGRLAILDWSLTGRLAKRDRELIAQVALAGLLRNAALACQGIKRLATFAPDDWRLRECVDAALGRLSFGEWPGPSWLVRLLDEVVAAGGRFSANLLLFRKTMLTLEGVIADIDPQCGLDDVLVSAAAQAFAVEWPWRALAPPASRRFATHISNMDLAAAMALAPASLCHASLRAWHTWLRQFGLAC